MYFIVYALSAFSLFLSEYTRSRIDSVFRKGRKWCTTDLSFNIEERIEASANDLFKKVQNRVHCSSSLLPPFNLTSNYSFNLRPRGHDVSLSSVKKVFLKSFIMRVLYHHHLRPLIKETLSKRNLYNVKNKGK